MKLSTGNQNGFTLVEILIVVGIIGVMAAIAVPHYMRYRMSSQRSVCVANIRQMQNAKVQWAFEKGQPFTATPLESDLIGPTNYLRDKPYCPSGGSDYITTIGTVQEVAGCSYGLTEGHTL